MPPLTKKIRDLQRLLRKKASAAQGEQGAAEQQAGLSSKLRELKETKREKEK